MILIIKAIFGLIILISFGWFLKDLLKVKWHLYKNDKVTTSVKTIEEMFQMMHTRISDIDENSQGIQFIVREKDLIVLIYIMGDKGYYAIMIDNPKDFSDEIFFKMADQELKERYKEVKLVGSSMQPQEKKGDEGKYMLYNILFYPSGTFS